jgi:TPR repeat protein
LSYFGRAFDACLWLAKEDDPLAQYNLGEMYARGLGVPPDYSEASVWLRRAADQGFAPAETALGDMFQQGRGMAVNDAEAAKWYRKAAEQGYAEAQHKLGVQYAEGWGVPRDDVSAYLWLTLASAAESSAYKDREAVVRRMSQKQIETAERLARAWTPALH